MAWEKTITRKGIELQAKILAGAPVIITRAAVGGDFVSPGQLADLSDVSSPLNAVIIDINPPEQIDDMATIKTVVTNEGLTSALTYHQIGVFAEDPDEGEILYMIAQDSIGNQLPSIDNVAEFQAKYDFEILVSLTSDITVIYDPESRVTHEQLSVRLDDVNVELRRKAQTNHKSQGLDYGPGDETNYGHLKADMEGAQSYSVQRKYLTDTTINLADYTNNSTKSGIYEFNSVTSFTNAPPDVNIPNPASGYITVHKNASRNITLGVELHIHGYSTVWLWGNGNWSKLEGGGGGMNPTLIITAPDGSTVIITKDGSQVTTYVATNEPTVITLKAFGQYDVTASNGAQTATNTVTVTQVQEYTVQLAFFSATLNVNTSAGANVTVTDGIHTYTDRANGNGVATFNIQFPNTYTVTATLNGVTTNPINAAVTTDGQTYNVSANFYKVMTVNIDLTNSNPETCITYADDAVGMTPGSDDWDEFFGHYPVLFKNGVEVGKLKRTNFAQFENGTTADITSGNTGDVMIAFPRRGVKIITVGDTLTISMTDDPDNVDFEYLAHTRDSTRKEKFYLGAYKGYNLSPKLRSLSGKVPTATQTIGTFRTQAQANGAGYEQSGFYQLTFRQSMYLLKYRNLDSQTAVGRGYVDGNSAAIATGGTNTKGMDWGETTGKQQMRLFGLEDFWGNTWEWIDGLVTNSTRDILTTTTNFNNNGTGYTNNGKGGTTDILLNMSKPQGTTKTGFIVKEVSGSATTYFCDSAILFASRVAYFGGHWSEASRSGAFHLYVNEFVDASRDFITARLMYL